MSIFFYLLNHFADFAIQQFGIKQEFIKANFLIIYSVIQCNDLLFTAHFCSMNQYANSPAVKRLMSEYKNLLSNPEDDFVAAPLENDLFCWHFTIKGPKDTPFEGGIYHGQIVFSSHYPLTPPDFYFFTPNGRFITDIAICLSISSFHPETWNPAWDVRTAIISIIAFFPTKSGGAFGGLDYSDAKRRELAIESRSWKCPKCSLTIEPDPLPQTDNHGKSENQTSNEIDTNQAQFHNHSNENNFTKTESCNQDSTDRNRKVNFEGENITSNSHIEEEEEEEVLDDPILEKFKSFQIGQNEDLPKEHKTDSELVTLHIDYNHAKKPTSRFHGCIPYIDIPIVIIFSYIITMIIKILLK